MIEKTQGTESRPRVSVKDLQRPVRAELDRVQEELCRFFISDVALINEISTHMLRANGKRFRPTLLLLANRLKGPASQEAIISATIVELVHTATLVHDDSIDRSFLRRGIPTVNSMWNDQTSVIMGDYLYSKAFFLLIEYGLIEVMQILARTTHRMSLGEMLELEHKLDFDLTEEVYYRLILDKTAVLISAACEIGAYLAWKDGQKRRLLTDFGTDLGMAFQITDDRRQDHPPSHLRSGNRTPQSRAAYPREHVRRRYRRRGRRRGGHSGGRIRRSGFRPAAGSRLCGSSTGVPGRFRRQLDSSHAS
jgi:hypothetical protein